MTDVEQLPALIGDIYDAALDPTRWSAVLIKTRDFIGGSAAAVFSKDASNQDFNVYYDCGGSDPHFTQLYFDTYGKLDPTTTGHVLADIGQPICTADIMDVDEFMTTRIYQEWARPQGLVDMGAAVLDRVATGASLFGVFRHERHGQVDDDTRYRMTQVVPHIRRALMMGRAFEHKAAQAATFAGTLDGLSAGMFLVDAAARVVHANASGHDFLAEGAVLRMVAGRLVPTDGAAARRLSEIFAAAGAGDAAIGTKGIAVPMVARDSAPYAAHVLPLTSGARRGIGTSYAAVAAVFVRKATVEAPSPPEVIASHYHLTPTELRVLLAIVEAGGVREAADMLGIGEATVKTHLHRLFGKTGASRQADLVKLVAGFSSPLVA